MALSLAACTSDDDTVVSASTDAATTTTTTTTTPTVAAAFDLTPLTDIASQSQALNGSISSDFRFTSGDDVVNGMSATIASADTLMDASSTDNDTLNLTLTTASGQDIITTLNIETLNIDMAAASASFDAASMTGLTTVNVSGAVDGSVDDVSAAATIKLDGYTRELTILDTNYSGTAAALNPDSINVEVSGTTFGSTAATQSKVALTAGSASTLETLNVASSGATANDFNLDASTNVTLSTVKVTGATDATVRMAEADITGLTFDATGATGDVSLKIDGNGVSGATNVLLFTGIDNLIMKDSTVGGDNANLNAVTAGQKVTLADDFTATTIAIQGSAYTAEAASITLALDNETAASDTDIANIGIQNTTALNLISSGFSTSTDTNAVNSTGVLSGDFSTITVSGDTSLAVTLDIDGKQTASGVDAARAVTVDASANTAFVSLDAATSGADSKVSYSLTGTAGADTLKLNDTAGTVSGGDGIDAITGGRGADTITAGAGNDTVNSSSGTDAVSLGAGVDSVVLVSGDVAAVAQENTITPVTTGAVYLANETITVTVNSEAKVYTLTAADVAGSASTDDDDLISASLTNFINAEFGDTVTGVNASAVITLTAKTAGTAFTLVVTDTSADAQSDYTEAASVANVLAIDTDVRVSDFVTSTGGDVIKFDLDVLNATVGIDNLLDSSGNLADTDDVTFVSYTMGTALAATGIAANANLVKVAYSSAITDSATLISGMANGFTLDAQTGSNTDAILAMFYDADDGMMVMGYMADTDADAGATTTGEYDDTNNTFTEMMQVTMTSAEYTAITTSSFDII
jgi:hypothetical protein